MSTVHFSLKALRKYRDFCLRAPSGREAQQVGQIGEQLRQLRLAAGGSRSQFAHRLHLDVELLVALENGYGNLHTARQILKRAQSLCQPES